MKKNISRNPLWPDWYNGKKIDEVQFGRAFLEQWPLKCVNGTLYTLDGPVEDESEIKQRILENIEEYVTSGLSKKVTNILETIKLLAFSDPFPIEQDCIHLQNGVYHLPDGSFQESRLFCQNRLPVKYDPKAASPDRWLTFLHELLDDADIPTLQEYLGYCLIPSTKGQKMMLIVGKGGEGKSRIGLVLKRLMGDAASNGSVQKVENNRFARADLERRLLMIDDDMDMNALPKTNYIKTIVTAEAKLDLERKGVQSYQRDIYARFLCFGNGALTSLYDHSDGFFRRQLILTTKDKPADRTDDPFLVEKMCAELEGILLWCLEGLHRLVQNDFRFTVSERAAANVDTIKRSSNNVIDFMESEGYFRFKADYSISSKEFYDIYTYEDEHGKSCDKWESFPTKEEATNRKKQIEHELAAGTFLIPSSVTVAEFLMDWLPKQCSKHKWAPKTYESNLSTIQNLIIPYIGSMEMQKLKPYHMENLYTTLSKTPCGSYIEGKKQELTEKQKQRFLSGTTIHEVHRLLGTAFQYAVEWGILIKSPVPVDSPKKSTQERSIWTVEEMRAALDSMDDPILHLAVHLTLVGALREGEIVGLTPEDIDFDAADGIGTFRINKSMQRVRKEALNQVDDGCIIKVFPDKLERSTTSLILKSTKTASSCRTIFMTSALKEELKKWLNQLAADEMKDPARYHDSGMLFRLPNGLAVEPVLIRKKFLKWQDAHPEFPRIVFHGLRHSSATYQLMISGGDVKAVQGTTGHATADMLVNTYAHIQQSSRVELGRKFEEGFYAKQESPSPQAVPAAGEPTISMTALLELLKNADPEVKAQLRLALLT